VDAVSQDLSMTLSHVGICTSNLDRSIAFYTEALGFEHQHTVTVTPCFDVTLEVVGMEARAAFLTRDGAMIELIGFDQPGVVGPSERRRMNQLGFTHMAFKVADIEPVAERIVRLGGRIHPETRASSDMGTFVFCTDPDGVRIELWEQPRTA
jgi:predicted enzyme related to lactoylglutathione lyase